MIKKRKKEIKTKYCIKLSNHEITTLIATLDNAIYDVVSELEDDCEKDDILNDLNIKYDLMNIISMLGFSRYDEHLASRKDIIKECNRLYEAKKKPGKENVEAKEPASEEVKKDDEEVVELW